MSQKNSFFSFYPLSINLLIVKVKCFLHFFITVKIFRIFMCTAVVVAYINTIKTTFDLIFYFYQVLKGVFGKNERGYRVTAKNKCF